MKTKQMRDEELEMELLEQLDDIEEEEEEEELDDELDDEIDAELDRGDEVDPDLPDDDPEEVDAEDNDEPADKGAGDYLDPDDLAELAGDSRSKSVPHSRFNEVNEALKTERAERLRLEEELARARGGAKPDVAPDDAAADDAPAGFDFDAAEERYAEAMYEGDQAAAKQIRGEIRQAERAELERLAEERAEKRMQERAQQQEQETLKQRVEAAATAAVDKYPFLNADGDEADPEAIEEVVALRDFYMARGTAADEAIAKAADKVGRRYAPESAPAAKPSAARLSRDTIERNLDRADRIPPRGVGAGERSQKIDYENLTEEQFDNLPDAEKRKARGDYVG